MKWKKESGVGSGLGMPVMQWHYMSMHLSTELSAPTVQFSFDLVHLASDKQLYSSMIRTAQNTLALHSGT